MRAHQRQQEEEATAVTVVLDKDNIWLPEEWKFIQVKHPMRIGWSPKKSHVLVVAFDIFPDGFDIRRHEETKIDKGKMADLLKLLPEGRKFVIRPATYPQDDEAWEICGPMFA